VDVPIEVKRETSGVGIHRLAAHLNLAFAQRERGHSTFSADKRRILGDLHPKKSDGSSARRTIPNHRLILRL
jgi:hypothetical protein